MAKILLGNNYGNLITDYSIKQTIIDFLYAKIDLSQYRYNILNSISKLQYLQDNVHYISPNFKGYNYFLLLLKINQTNYNIIIDRKKLSYHKNYINIKNIELISIKLNIDDCLYDGTIIDGKIINANNIYIYLIQDCFYLKNINLINMNLKAKLQYLDINLKTHIFKNDENHFLDFKSKLQLNNNYSLNFHFKINKLYNYCDLVNLIQSFHQSQIYISGLIFFPPISNINIIYIDKKQEIKKDLIIENHMIYSKSYDIINNYVDFLKSRTYVYEQDINTKDFWLRRRTFPDVYNISEKENGEKIGIAFIPTLKISYLCDSIITDKACKFKCVYSDRFKKWIPIVPI